MTNRPKARGTAAETAVVRYARTHGYPWAERLALQGAADCGDISLIPGRAAIIEVKSYAGAPSAGQPGPALLAEWMAQTAAERDNAGADLALLVVRRKGTTDPGRWFAYATVGDLAVLAGDAHLHHPGSVHLDAPVCLALADMLNLARGGGYGEPPSDVRAATPAHVESAS